MVVGGLTFDGSKTYSTISWRIVGRFTATGTTGTCRCRLYDIGPIGGPTIRILRSVAEIPFGSAGATDSFATTLTTNGAPGVDADEIFNTVRVYEVEIELVGADGVSDTFRLYKAGIEVLS